MIEALASQLETAGSPREDLAQAAYGHLVKLAARYDPAVGVRFGTYAKHRLRGAMLDARRLDRQRGTGRPPRGTYRMILTADGNQLMTCAICEAVSPFEGGPPTCPACGYAHKTVPRISVVSFCEVTCPPREDGSDALPEDMLPGVPATQYEEAAAEGIWSLIAACDLPRRLVSVLRLRYADGLTMREVGDALEVTESRASQLHREAIERVRDELALRGVTSLSALM
jgi:RNA polymerase sigma factor for flagellar operon FliA